MRSLLICFAVLILACSPTPRSLRPTTWATPVASRELRNLHRLDDALYRCEQPDDEAFAELKTLGIRSVLNLRELHSDDEAAGLGLELHHLRWDTRQVTIDQVVEALRIIRAVPKPLVVHCWHGSDRTGTVCAAYRIVFGGWSMEDAVDEMLFGGFGYHMTFDNLPWLLREADWAAVKRRVME